jgi:hypothetical protein
MAKAGVGNLAGYTTFAETGLDLHYLNIQEKKR